MNALVALKEVHQQTRWQWYLVLASVLLAWLAVAWLQSEAQTRSDLGEQVQQAQQASETGANVIVKVIQQSVANLDGIAAYLAQEPDIRPALVSAPQVSADATPAQRKQVWSNNALLMQENNHLRQAALLMGADALFVLDRHGRAIASSNADTPGSFVGTDFADRHYFQAALAGKTGRQYAMGRKSNVPGLYFSAPIRQHDQVIGVLSIKVNLPRLAYWVNQVDAFITDEYDVVIMARDKSFEMRALSGARIQALSSAARDARYKRKDFPELALPPRTDLPFGNLFSVAERPNPCTISQRSLPDIGLTVHVIQPLPSLSHYAAEHWHRFLPLAAGGSLIILIVGGSLIFGLQRRQSERNIAASLSLHKATIESTSDGILVVDTNSHITTYNQRFLDLWRIPQTLLGEGQDIKLLDYVSAQLQNPEEFMRGVHAINAAPETISFDVLTYRDGRVFERHSYPQRLNDKVIGRVWNFRDVTLRNQALEKLAQSELELQTIIDTEPECVKVLAADGTLLKINRAGLAMIEADDPGSVIGQKIGDVIAPEHRFAFAALTRRVFEGQSGTLQFRVIGLKGGVRWLDTHSVPLRDTHGSIIALLGVTRDITEAKRATHHLHLVDYALDHVSEAAFLADASGHFTYVNAEACRSLGYSQQELLELHIDKIDANMQPGEWTTVWSMLQKQGDMIFETDHRHKDGTTFPVEVSATAFEFDEQPFALGLVRDIRERKAAELERTQLQQQLQHAQKLEAIGQLTGGIAHDFNNILGAILGFTGLTLDRYGAELPEKVVGYLGEVQKAGERARDLIQKMLAFARGNGGDAQLIDPRSLVREVIKMLSATLPSSLELKERIDEAIPSLRIDPVQLHQILTNLVINARDATEGEGHINVGLRITRLTGEICDICHQAVRGEFVELFVQDDGSGIPPETLPKIFDPFFTTKEVGKGTGMGLAMVMGILREHDAHILVETRPGLGTTFRLFFHPAHGHSPEYSAQVVHHTSPAVCAHRILVVDDEVSLGELMGEILEVNGYCANVHTNPLAALAEYEANPDSFAALITDQTMPGMTGLELVRDIRALSPNLPIIMVSGYSDKVDADSAEQHGIAYFFYKPVKSDVLLSALKEMLK